MARWVLITRADLVAVGTHQRRGLGRWWYGSVSQGVLHTASMNVACVPVVTQERQSNSQAADRRTPEPSRLAPRHL